MKVWLPTVLMPLVMAAVLFAEQTETTVRLETTAGTLEGSLVLPGETNRTPVALIVAGSGPTDRDGNNPVMKNNSLKMLATALSKRGIATLRYDKRGIGKSEAAGMKEEDLRFDHYISDAKQWIDLLKKDKRFSEVTVIGHSEGSLLGMIASREGSADRFISVAGAGKPADKLLKDQMQSQPPQVSKAAVSIIDRLVEGKTVDKVDLVLYSLFRPSVQPYMISWFKYDPAKEIAKLKIPVLIVQGSTDIQVGEKDARMLAAANAKAEIRIIQGMNHIFKEVESDRMKNIATYNQPDLPIKNELVEAIGDFIGRPAKTGEKAGAGRGGG